MPLIHMEPFDPVIPESPEYLTAADSENNFLAEPIMLITPVKKMGERSVPFRIFRKIRIQKIDRDLKTADAFNFIPPRTEMNDSSLNLHGGSWQHLFEEIFDGPFTGFLPLLSVRAES